MNPSSERLDMNTQEPTWGLGISNPMGRFPWYSLVTNSMMNWNARVDRSRYIPRRRSAGRPTSNPIAPPSTPVNANWIGHDPSGVPVVPATVNAPTAMKPAPPNDTWPACPMSQSWPTAAMA